MAGPHFRAGVVVVVRHPDGRRVLAFERADAAGSWQLPQGGIEPGEEPIEAAWRELHEETGLGAGQVVPREEFPEWVAYEWPAEVRAGEGQRRGQVQRWFFFDALDPAVVPRPDGREFVAWRWADPGWLIDQVVEWRRPAYRRALGAG